MNKLRPHLMLIVSACLIALGALLHRTLPVDPDALWRIVSTQCVPGQSQHNDPAPCALVDTARGYAVLKDIKGKSQFLLIPTKRIAGIEYPSLLNTNAPNYFAAAWEARRFTEEALKKKLPRQEVALAINSMQGRTQNQLHIHIDCVRRDVRNVLRAHQSEISATDWTKLSVPLMRHSYRVRRVDGETLGAINPFALLATQPDAHAAMGQETLAIAGAVFEGGKPGFILLSDKADPAAGDHASAAELLDHSCAVAHEFAP